MTERKEHAEDEVHARFRDYYDAAADAPVIREIERRVLGAAYGGTSYTDVSQARRLAELLDLQEGVELCEVGAGAGWPGLFLARETGCRVTLTDLPYEGLRTARSRALSEGIDGRVVAASGTHLPFRAGSFDAVSHSDVLC